MQPAAEPRVTVIVVTYAAAAHLPACLDGLAAQTVAHRVVVVDNASADGTAALLAARCDLTVIRTERNEGFSGGTNRGLTAVDTPLVALLNDDAVPEPRWLEHLLAAADSHPGAAAFASLVMLDEGRVDSAGGSVDGQGRGHDLGFGKPLGADLTAPGEVFYASGAACLWRVAAVRAVGLFDRDYFLYYEDTDLCWRLWLAGHAVRYVPQARVRHAHSATVGQFSRLQVVYGTRNRLLTLVKDATVTRAAAAVLPYLGYTLALLARGELTGRDRAAARWRAEGVARFLAALPAAVAGRRQVEQFRRVPRREVEAQMLRLHAAGRAVEPASR